MNIDTWHEWMFFWSYYLAQLIFMFATIILSSRTRKISSYLFMVGFVAFFVGNVMMLNAGKDLLELKQLGSDLNSAENVKMIGRIMSSLGFLVSSVSLVFFAVTMRKEQKGGRKGVSTLK